jgi:putative AlgH/UPF0301 family transcriptional regulator
LAPLSDPHHSRVVLVGASTYAHLPQLPTVAANLSGLSGVLTDPLLWGLPPEHCRVVSDPKTPQQVERALRAAAAASSVGGLLLVYYAGHGVVDDRTGELHLAVEQTDREAPYATAVPYEWIRRGVLASPASRRVVILDCCYAGRAISGMGELTAVADEVEIDRTCVLVATSPNRAAVAPPDEPYTAFTGALLDVLRAGVPGGPDPLDVATVYDEVVRIQRRRGRPRPELRARNAGERVSLVRNAARPAAAPAVAPPGPGPEVPAHSQTGRVVLAHPARQDPDLRGATVAILAHTPGEGAIGVRLDRPSARSTADVLGDRQAAALGRVPVFEGGPVGDVVLLLATPRPGARPPAGFRPVQGNLGTVPVTRQPAPALAAACVFVGYLGWRPGQLEEELAAGELVAAGATLDDWFHRHASRY